jgi:hypothetical protein
VQIPVGRFNCRYGFTTARSLPFQCHLMLAWHFKLLFPISTQVGGERRRGRMAGNPSIIIVKPDFASIGIAKLDLVKKRRYQY